MWHIGNSSMLDVSMLFQALGRCYMRCGVQKMTPRSKGTEEAKLLFDLLPSYLSPCIFPWGGSWKWIPFSEVTWVIETMTTPRPPQLAIKPKNNILLPICSVKRGRRHSLTNLECGSENFYSQKDSFHLLEREEIIRQRGQEESKKIGEVCFHQLRPFVYWWHFLTMNTSEFCS